jgi:hypothetical protein
MASDVKPPKDNDDVPDELKPSVLLMSFMVKVKVAPVVDEEDQELIQEKLSEIFNDENLSDMLSAYLSDEENAKALDMSEGDVDTITENVVFEVSD